MNKYEDMNLEQLQTAFFNVMCEAESIAKWIKFRSGEPDPFVDVPEQDSEPEEEW